MTLPNDLSSVIKTLTSKGYNITSVFDIGANKGTWTAKYAAEIPKAKFCLFEANPKHPRPTRLDKKHQWFSGVLSSPEKTEVTFYVAQGARPGTGDSYYKEQTHVYDNAKPVTLKTTTVDEMVKEHSLPLPQLIKLDTQGAEIDILRGAEDTLKHTDIVITETPLLPYNEGAPTFDDYLNFFRGEGFVPVGIDDIIFANSLLTHVDLVFLRKEINTKYYGDNKLFTKGFKV